jgi:hypothetical protein
MARYIYEYGARHLYFGGTDRLTRELAVSSTVHDVRLRYYEEGDTAGPVEYEFGHAPFFATLITGGPFSVASFVGGFRYQVRTLEGRVGFRIDNDTTLESATHLAGRYSSGGYRGSVEDLITANPSLGTMPLVQIIADHTHYPVMSILSRRSREETEAPMGGGDFYQTFTWTEVYDPCLAQLLPWQVRAYLLEIGSWWDFARWTEPVFEVGR